MLKEFTYLRRGKGICNAWKWEHEAKHHKPRWKDSHGLDYRGSSFIHPITTGDPFWIEQAFFPISLSAHSCFVRNLTGYDHLDPKNKTGYDVRLILWGLTWSKTQEKQVIGYDLVGFSPQNFRIKFHLVFVTKKKKKPFHLVCV